MYSGEKKSPHCSLGLLGAVSPEVGWRMREGSEGRWRRASGTSTRDFHQILLSGECPALATDPFSGFKFLNSFQDLGTLSPFS